MMKTKENKKGISLIVLITTIIVVIILAAVVILTLSKNNPIESAKEARFKEDVRTFQDELALTVSKQYAQAAGKRDYKISTSSFGEIKDYIPSFSEKYKDKFVIKNDELNYTNVTNIEEKWCKELNISDGIIYKELEYIESTGEQWIDSDCIFNINSTIESKFCFTQNVGYYAVPYGCENSANVLGISSLGPNGIVYTHFGNKRDVTIGASVGNKNIYIQNKDGVWVNGQKKASYTNAIVSDSSQNIFIFARSGANGSASRISYMKFYYLKIYDNDKIVRDFIPVLDKNNKPALYDKVEGKFYYNQGNGEDFRYGLKE